jgi:hypothetical protein
MERLRSTIGAVGRDGRRLSERLWRIAADAWAHAESLGDEPIDDPDANPYPYLSALRDLRSRHRGAAAKLQMLARGVAKRGLTPATARELSTLLASLAADHREEGQLVWRMYAEDIGVCD